MPESRELMALRKRVQELEEAIKPLAFFARQWQRQPMRGMDDVIYAIHMGTEYEAELRRSDLDRLAALMPEETHAAS
jgi:hypothetical protein